MTCTNGTRREGREKEERGGGEEEGGKDKETDLYDVKPDVLVEGKGSDNSQPVVIPYSPYTKSNLTRNRNFRNRKMIPSVND